MSFQSALELTSLADRLREASGQGMTDADRQVVTDSVLKIAGVTPDELNQAIDASVGGNDSFANHLLSKVAQNLGMPSDSVLRDQILPSLGVSLSK